jgi:hypothetical protein
VIDKKPLGGKAYGHIPHLPGSRMGPGDHHCHPGQAQICTVKPRDKHDRIIVQEKVDGTCVSVARIGNNLYPLTRSGYLAHTSPYRQHWLFGDWAMANYSRFMAVLVDGERLCGEWLAQAHGTRYELPHEPFVAFDIMTGTTRYPHDDFMFAVKFGDFVTPRVISDGRPMPIHEVLTKLEPSGHGALDPVEGAVWRVERKDKVDFLAKYVRPDKIDGRYLPEISGQDPVWNWEAER